VSVHYERRGAAAWVTFDRPRAHNALTYAMYDRLVECCEAADADDAVRALVLRGAGGRAFVAGTDIRTPEASFGMPIARTVGNCLSIANYARLAAILGEARLKALIFLARTIAAEEALAVGLATELVAAAVIEARVTEVCELLAGHAPATLAVTKAALRRLRPLPDGDDLILEAYGSAGFRENVQRFLAR
jgi:enoyl-CoA hydratase